MDDPRIHPSKDAGERQMKSHVTETTAAEDEILDAQAFEAFLERPALVDSHDEWPESSVLQATCQVDGERLQPTPAKRQNYLNERAGFPLIR
jgi:hypothetical protein